MDEGEKKEYAARLNAAVKEVRLQWVTEAKHDEIRALIEEWSLNEGVVLTGAAVRDRLGISRAFMFQIVETCPDLKALYKRAVIAKIECVKVDLLMSAAGETETMEKGRAYQTEFFLRGYDPEYIRRVENTGKDGGPVQVEFITASAAGE